MSAEKQLMGAFKLNLYESRVYLSLLRGEMSPKEIAKASNVPLPRTYDILSSLESKGFVERRSKGGFSAIAPRAALDGRIAQFERGFRKEQEEREKSLAKLIKMLEPPFKMSTPPKEDEVAVLHGINAIANKFNEILSASNDVLFIVRRAAEAKEFFVNQLESLELSSKRIRILVSKDVRIGKEERLLIGKLGLRLKQVDDIILFDVMAAGESTIMIGVPDPFSEEPFHSLAVMINSRSFNKSIRKAVEPIFGREDR